MMNYAKILFVASYIACMLGMGWLLLANGVWFIRARRRKALQQSRWLLYWLLLINILFWFLSDQSIGLFTIFSLVLWTVTQWLEISRYWRNKTNVHGFVSGRDFLLLRQPIEPTFRPDPSKGLYVPSLVNQDNDQTVDVEGWIKDSPHRLKQAAINLPKLLLISFVIVVVFFLITKVLFGFGPF